MLKEMFKTLSYQGNVNQNTLRVHLTAVRSLPKWQLLLGRMWVGQALNPLLVGLQTRAATMEVSCGSSSRKLGINAIYLKTQLSHSWACTQSHFSIPQKHLLNLFIVALFKIPRALISLNRWTDKENVVHLHNGELISKQKMRSTCEWRQL